MSRDMKRCELCKGKARIHCDSDQASLCWDCDARVHSANFLVARHSRNLLCHLCQSPTPWFAAGPKMGPTFSVCKQCAHAQGRSAAAADESQICTGEQEEVIEVVEENQVVPPPPSEESSSSGDEEAGSDAETGVSTKRRRIRKDSSDLRKFRERKSVGKMV